MAEYAARKASERSKGAKRQAIMERRGAKQVKAVVGKKRSKHAAGAGGRIRLQTQSDPPEDDRGKHDGGGEVCCELVVAGGDASPVLEAAEHALDEIALAIGDRIEGMMAFAGRVVRNDRDGPTLEEKATQSVAVVSGVGGEPRARWNGADQSCRDANVAAMSRRHFDGDGTSARVDDGVDFRRATAARAANRLRLGPPFPPAADRCALAVLLSIA